MWKFEIKRSKISHVMTCLQLMGVERNVYRVWKKKLSTSLSASAITSFRLNSDRVLAKGFQGSGQSMTPLLNHIVTSNNGWWQLWAWTKSQQLKYIGQRLNGLWYPTGVNISQNQPRPINPQGISRCGGVGEKSQVGKILSQNMAYKICPTCQQFLDTKRPFPTNLPFC